MKKSRVLFLILLLSAPAFLRMLRPGIYSMQDFHLFRLYEFDQCVRTLQIPCRWAADAGLGYGEPLFNFYGQLPYAAGEIFHLLGFSLINSLKALFILSIVGSGISMYFLAKHFWKSDFAAFISVALYLYAPYRAVDVWVRGALPEALSFVLFPLIILAIEKKIFWRFSLLFAALILTHNLSALMFLPIIVVWVLYRKFWRAIPAGLVSLGLSAFYVLPVIFESRFIKLANTTEGYFNFRAHFLTLKQIFLDFSWGYGGSTWGEEDGLNLSVGLIQWILPAIALVLILIKKELKKFKSAVLLFGLGIFVLFLTHNRSTFLWEALPFTAYLQFPWRFLGVAVFCFSLASGAVANLLGRKLVLVLFLLLTPYIVYLTSYFRPDIWYKVADSYFTTGEEWNRQRAASIGDFWPNLGREIPTSPSDGKYINYFPGWNKEPDENGLILAEGAKFNNTRIRNVGNIVSLATLCVSILFSLLL